VLLFQLNQPKATCIMKHFIFVNLCQLHVYLLKIAIFQRQSACSLIELVEAIKQQYRSSIP